ncbi:MAG: TIM barrel protein [Kiritimatiellales bacterium]|nr:TIM barrel protein [Kiritimatiellales bacterium]
MNRRAFSSTVAAAAAIGVAGLASRATAESAEPFKLNYAPGFRHFKNSAGPDPINQIKFMHDTGFRAMEDNGMMQKDPALQQKIGNELARLEMTMGVFVLGFGMNTYMFTSNLPDGQKKDADPAAVRAAIKAECEKALETQKRVNAKWCTVVPGAFNPNIDYDYQFANVVANLKYGCEILEPAGLVMVLEPLNHMNHPGAFLKTVPQAYAVCKAVSSPSCKILNDLYHEQIEIGNLINNIDSAWDEIAYIQVGDVPGRNEPSTGEINYKNVFKHLYDKGYKGLIGMEHGISRKGIEGEQRLIQSYREVDSFEA